MIVSVQLNACDPLRGDEALHVPVERCPQSGRQPTVVRVAVPEKGRPFIWKWLRWRNAGAAKPVEDAHPMARKRS